MTTTVGRISLAVQLLCRAGVRVLAVAGSANQNWLASLGAEPVVYGDGLEERLRTRAPNGVDASIDAFGDGYVELAIKLGVAPVRINTVVGFLGARRFGTRSDGGMAAATAEVLAELAAMIAAGELIVEISATFPVEQVREAYAKLAERHTRGKIALRMR
ncbi:zinc-binding dehydrogenase [Streptomyces sp. NPDC058470]|uniref:zinc-binding dehydrogenase n=1 Tax=Streptomyces sp. NPDC058470 TaxID=3346515 RepID=UPI003649BDCC